MGNVLCFLSSADFFKVNFFEKFFQEHYQSVKQFLDPDQARHFVGPDLGPNCLQRLSADNTRRQSLNGFLTTGKELMVVVFSLQENL